MMRSTTPTSEPRGALAQLCRSRYEFFVSVALSRESVSRYRTLKAERRKEIKAVEAALRLAQRKSRGVSIPEDADAHGRAAPRLLILYGTQVSC